MLKKLTAILILVAVLSTTVFARQSYFNDYSSYLSTLGLYTAVSPQNTFTKYNGAAATVAFMKKSTEAESQKNESPFTDIKEASAKNSIGYLYAKGIVASTPNNLFGASSSGMNPNEFAAYLLCILGYERGVDFEAATALQYMYDVGILSDTYLIELGTVEMIYDDAVFMMYNTLFAKYKNSSQTYIEMLYKSSLITEAQVRATKNPAILAAALTDSIMPKLAYEVTKSTEKLQKITDKLSPTQLIATKAEAPTKAVQTTASTAPKVTASNEVKATTKSTPTVAVKTKDIATADELKAAILSKQSLLESSYTLKGAKGIDLYALAKKISFEQLGNITSYTYNATTTKDSKGKLLSVSIDFNIVYSDSYCALSAFENPSMESKLTEKQKLLLDTAKKIIASIIKDGMTDYEKELAIHDYVVLNCRYDSQKSTADIVRDSYSAYGVLVKGLAVCQGYAESMYLLLNMVDIDCINVTGTSKNIPHQWNKVKIDGDWYNLDSTWNDPMPDKKGIVHYDYFNVTDEQLKADHIWKNESLPVAASTKYNYFEYNKLVASNYEEFKNIITNTLKTSTTAKVYVKNYNKATYDLNFLYSLGYRKISYSEPSGKSGVFMVTPSK